MKTMGIITTVTIETTKTLKTMTIMTTVRNKKMTTEYKIYDKRDVYNNYKYKNMDSIVTV
jgi:hypothetical protein